MIWNPNGTWSVVDSWGRPLGGGGAAAAVEPLLSSTLVLGSGSYAATARFEGTDASAAGWADRVSGTVLALGGIGTDPTYGVATPFALPTAVDFNTGKSFIAPNNTLLNVTDANADIVLEMVFQFVTNGAENAVAGKYAAGNTGPLVVSSTAPGTNVYGIATFSLAGLVSGTWYHVILFADRNGNTRLYRNTLSASAATSAASMNTATPFCIGSYNNGATSKSNSLVALYQQWNIAAGSVGNAADCDAVAAARYATAQANGFVP